MTRDYNIAARLSIAGESAPLSSFRVIAPAGSIGAQVSCDLADPTAAIGEDGDVLLEVGIGPPGDEEWVALLDVGGIRELRQTYAWLADAAAINAVSALALKWDISPKRPVILFDPEQVEAINTSSGSLDDLVDENHELILPERIEVRDFDLVQLLNYVYVERLGFARVVTNIANFRLKTVAISMQETFHAAAAREVALFEPVYHADDADTLFIIDPQGTQPTGLDSRKLRLKNYAQLDTTKEVGRNITAVILSYRDNLTASSAGTIRSETEIKTINEFNDDDWQRTSTTRFILDFHDNPANPDEVTRSVVTRVKTEVTARADGAIRVVARDDQSDLYAYDYRLKVGYNKDVWVYCKTPTALSASLRFVQREENRIFWDELSSRPGEFIKRYETTGLKGLVLVKRDDPGNPLLVTERQSAYIANRLNEDMADWADVETDRAISTQIDVYRFTGTDQIEVNSQKINHLVPQAAPQQTNTFQHTGTIIAAVRPQTPTVNQFLEAEGVTDSERRPPLRINAGNVPYETARLIADRILKRRNSKPVAVTAELAGIDLSLRRGSIRRAHDRAGNVHKVFVTGFEIIAEQLGTPAFKVTMTMTGIVIE